MIQHAPVWVFGEVLFDCFPDDQRVLGGAPFNVAWHLQALGDEPHFVSRVGDDALGRQIIDAMLDWGMKTESVQIDESHATGQVEVNLINGEPHYTITPDCAYDFIDSASLQQLPQSGILYHGTLGLRNAVSEASLYRLAEQPEVAVFLDVNLRTPWWQHHDVFKWLQRARWVKLNEDELRQLGFDVTNVNEAMRGFQAQFKLEQVIVTRGADGVIVLDDNGNFYQEIPESVDHIVDSVGAGDGFSAFYIHGIISQWPIAKTLVMAQHFAVKILGIRGATPSQTDFYQEFSD